MRTKRAMYWILSGGCALQGCSLPVDGASPQSDGGALAEATAALKGAGSVTKEPQYAIAGVVDIVGAAGSGCTASMIGPNLILTAAHCFQAYGAGAGTLSGVRNFTVNYYDPDDGRHNVYTGPATWYAYPEYEADPNLIEAQLRVWTSDAYLRAAAQDVGLLVLPRQFDDTDYHDYLRIYRDGDAPLESGRIRVYGAGYRSSSGGDDDELRWGEFIVEDVSPNFTVVDNSVEVGVCHGDSGGPAVEFATRSGQPVPTVAGVLSLMDALFLDGNCVADVWGDFGPDNAYYTRITAEKLTWIESVIGSTCALSTASSNRKYVRCFNVPFIEDINGEGLDRGVAIAIASML